MKKYAVFLFSTLLALSLTACGGSDNTQNSSSPSSIVSEVSTNSAEESKTETPTSSTDISEPSTDESKSETPASTPSSTTSTEASESEAGILFQKYIDLTQSGTFYTNMEYSVTTSDGTTTKIPLVMAADGQKAYMKTMMFGQEICIFSDGTDTYMLDDTKKIASKVDSSSVTSNNEVFGDSYKLLDSGTEDYNGTSCRFEKYNMNGIEETMYFNDSGDLIAFTASQNDADYVYTVNAFTNEIPDGLFEVPSGYTVTEYSVPTME